jgi:hypothetical protein
MPARRIEAGPLLVLLGAVLLLVALFLDWYVPGLTAWDVFELLDLVLAALAVGAALTAAAQLGALAGPDPRGLPWCCGAAFLLVVATVFDAPPAASSADADTGLWVALAAVVVMGIGAVLVGARVKISLDVEGRRRRVSPVVRESRRPAAAADAPFDQEEAASRRFDGADEPDRPGTLRPRRRAAEEPDPAGDLDDEEPTYRMPFDRDVPGDDEPGEPLRPDEPWAERPRPNDPGSP